ncbi:MAG: malate synthase A [Verrucomicrobia bacterium]|nr:malate synthase A [Verrucomicrobiota bacterium]
MERIFTPESVSFITKLHKKFNPRRQELLALRATRQKPEFLAETEHIRQDPSWKVAPPPKELEKRYVEITGPAEKKMIINALNSGADVFMADFEDAMSPTWDNVISGQEYLIDAIDGTLTFTNTEGKVYRLNEKRALLMVRPRGWHLEEKHLMIEGSPISASIFDAGLYFFHNAKRLLEKGTAPYFYLPKMESHLEARLWNDIFVAMQEELGLPKGTIRCTVLIETIMAAFEMEEILYELKDHCVGLNAGRWDYIFSIIKKFQHDESLLLPDRSQITMTVPFMRAYTDLLITTCHKRGAHAMGGMSAFVPSRKNPQINSAALLKVADDKIRESQDGFDGTWVAHPDLVPVAMKVFTETLQGRPNQKDHMRPKVHGRQLIDFKVPNGSVTEQGFRQNVIVALRYLVSWLKGQGAVTLNNLMEDLATAEIARSQIWQWIRHENVPYDAQFVREILEEEREKLDISDPRVDLACRIIDDITTDPVFYDFLGEMSYRYLQ